MKIGIYFCKCGTIIAEKIHFDKVMEELEASGNELYSTKIDYLCNEQGMQNAVDDLVSQKPDRVLFVACSPRNHEGTCKKIMQRAEMNPYLMQMINAREHIAWVIEDPNKATKKVKAYLQAAINRVLLHEPLESEYLEVNQDVLILGAGPAGIKAALSFARSDRNVILVEKKPVVGGLPVTFEDVAPSMECGPCLLEPALDDLLHGDNAEKIELYTQAEVTEIKGFFGNFIATITQQPRYVDTEACLGCSECVHVCPEKTTNEFNEGLNERTAIAFPFLGGLPNAPFIDMELCRCGKEEECSLCVEACAEICGTEDIIQFNDTEKIVHKDVGAILLATGADLYDCTHLSEYGYGTCPDVYSSQAFERITASNGPTEGEIITSYGQAPRSVAIVHCAGSLDDNHKSYCSGICCQYALKYSHLIHQQHPDAQIFHFYKELSLPGNDSQELYKHVRSNEKVSFIRYDQYNDLAVKMHEDHQPSIEFKGEDDKWYRAITDMIILCPPSVPNQATETYASMLDLTRDPAGFFESLHARIDPAQSKIKGVYLAGSCQGPKDIQATINQAMAVSGYVLSELSGGRKIEIEPIFARIDENHCSGCRICIQVCPYKAISYNDESHVSVVNPILCQGCGTCVAACPSGVITGNHFTDEEIFSEIEGMLV